MGSSFEQSATSSEHLDLSSEHLDLSSEHLDLSSEHLALSPEQPSSTGGERDSDGCWRSTVLDAPLVDDLSALTWALRSALEESTALARTNKKLPEHKIRELILSACKDQYLTLNVLAQLLNRSSDGLRQQHLREMVRNHDICLAFPTTPTHEKQAYRTARDIKPC
jgi:hypothetical protein